jgi:hypothetical protein
MRFVLIVLAVLALLAPGAAAQTAIRYATPVVGASTLELADNSEGLWLDESAPAWRWRVEPSPLAVTRAVRILRTERANIYAWGYENRFDVPFLNVQQNFTWGLRWQLPGSRRLGPVRALDYGGFTYVGTRPNATAFDGLDDCSGTSGYTWGTNHCTIPHDNLITDPATVARFTIGSEVRIDAVIYNTSARWYGRLPSGELVMGDPGHEWRVRCDANLEVQSFVVIYYTDVPGA